MASVNSTHFNQGWQPVDIFGEGKMVATVYYFRGDMIVTCCTWQPL